LGRGETTLTYFLGEAFEKKETPPIFGKLGKKPSKRIRHGIMGIIS